MKRQAEKLHLIEVGNVVSGEWRPIFFHHLRKGDVYRLWDIDEDGTRHPDTTDKTWQVCVCLTDPESCVNERGEETPMVQSLGTRLFHTHELTDIGTYNKGVSNA